MWWLIGIAAVFAALGGAFSGVTDGPSDEPKDPNEQNGGKMSDGKILWWMLEQIPWLDDTQRYFLFLTAHRESKFHPRAHNDSASEVDASARAWDKLSDATRAQLEAAGVTKSVAAIGSVGLFQRLAPYFITDMLKHFDQVYPPEQAYDRDFAIIDAIMNARALQTKYDAFAKRPTVGTLRLGWWGPGKMGDFPEREAKLNSYREEARELKLPNGIVDAKINLFPASCNAILVHLSNIGSPPSS